MIDWETLQPTRIYCICPGIRTRTSDNNNWAPVMASRINRYTNAKGDEFRYFEFGFRTEKEQTQRAFEFWKVCKMFMEAGHEVIGVFHSNGGEIAQRVMDICRSQRDPNYFFTAYHLIAVAADGDFESNGYNKALRCGALRDLVWYWSDRDEALNDYAPWTQFFGRIIGKGYKRGGGAAPQNVASDIEDRVEHLNWGCRHSEYFEAPYLNTLYASVARLELA